jgi:hypothetical protein
VFTYFPSERKKSAASGERLEIVFHCYDDFNGSSCFCSRSNHSDLIFSSLTFPPPKIILICFLSYGDNAIYVEINAREITAPDDEFDTANINFESNFFAISLSSSALNIEAFTARL